jgi:acyl-CoA thioesterase
MNFSELLGRSEPRDDGFVLAIPEDWHQGRTAYGGLSAALALTAAMRIGGELPPLRSAQVSFVGPLYGAVEVRAQVLRRGKNASWVSAEILREGEVGLTASFVFMGPVASELHLNERPLPEGAVPLDEARSFVNPHAPTFIQNHFELRFALPKTAEKQPEICWWMRPREHAELDPMTALLLTADGLPPGVMPLLSRRAPLSSMHWQANLLTPAPATRDGWWLLRSAGDYAESGCSSQRMAIWNADGEPVMAGMQSVAVFG